MNLPEIPSNVPDPQLRITAAQRDNAIGLLREAAGDGRLTFEELDARLPLVLAATTREGLYRVLGDIVPAAELAEVVSKAAQPSGEGEGWHWETPLVIEKQSTVIGDWLVPPFIEVVTDDLGVKVDMCLARPGADVIDLMVTGTSALRLVVPEGWGVDIQQVKQTTNGIESTSGVRSRPAAGKPRVIVRGHAPLGLKVRHPNWWDRRAQRRWLKQNRPSPG